MFCPQPTDTVRPTRAKPRFLVLGFGALLIYLAFLPPGIYSIDGNSMLAVSDSMLHGSITVPTPELGTRGRNGALYSNWYPLLSVVSLPFVALGATAGHLLHLPVHYVEAICALFIPALCTACTIPLVSLLAQQLGADNTDAYLAALVYGFGTIALVYTRTFYAEPLLALLSTAAICFAFAIRPIPAAALSLFSVLAKPAGIFVGPLLSAYLFAKTRKLSVSSMPAIGCAFGLALYAFYNVYRFGHPFAFGQPWSFSMHSLPGRFAGLLVSPGWGLLWYSPSAILGLAGIPYARKRWEVLTLLAVFASFLGLHALWTGWNGGWSWGPRLLLPALPGLVALSALLPPAARKAMLAIALVTFILTVPTMFSFYERYFAEVNERGVPFSELVWSPSSSPLLHAWPAAFHSNRATQPIKIYGRCLQPVVPQRKRLLLHVPCK